MAVKEPKVLRERERTSHLDTMVKARAREKVRWSRARGCKWRARKGMRERKALKRASHKMERMALRSLRKMQESQRTVIRHRHWRKAKRWTRDETRWTRVEKIKMLRKWVRSRIKMRSQKWMTSIPFVNPVFWTVILQTSNKLIRF